jgi:glycosyltransferase involved in cell wall biosynthesis
MTSSSIHATDKHRVLYSGFRWEHHDDESGYHHVVVSGADYVDGGQLWGSDGSVRSLRRRLNFIMIDLLTIVRAVPYRAVLLFYPEQTSYVSPLILRLMGKRVVYVVHLGEDYWMHRDGSLVRKLKRFNLRFVDKFITLTSQQQAVFERDFPGRVARISHGAWCRNDKAEHSNSSSRSCRIAVVGDTYRDYRLLERILVFFEHRYPEVMFDLVGMKPERLKDVHAHANVVCHRRLSREAYGEVLRGALFMLLPLQFATANNALLEGLTAGLPVICSDVEGAREYLPEGDYVFDSIDDLAIKFEYRLTLPQADRDKEARMLISYARKNYSWEVIRERVHQYCLA